MKSITAFTWGYWGWGTHAREFIRGVIDVECARGWGPPVFADIRHSRSVRAANFRDNTFEKLCGRNNYVWLQKLGNRRVGESRPGIKITDPSAAAELVDLIIKANKSKRRVIFFCSCERPEGCHRSTVAGLVRREARRRGLKLSTIEWPGGEPKSTRLSVEDKVVKKVLNDGMRVSLTASRRKVIDLYFSLPWGSRVLLCSEEKEIAVIAGPAKLGSKWYLPIIGPRVSRETDSLTSLKDEAARLRWPYRELKA